MDELQTYVNYRFRIVGPEWRRSKDGQATTSDGARLVATTVEGERWYEFNSNQPMTVSDIDRWVISPITTLASLVTANSAEAVDLHVRLTDSSPWRKVYSGDEGTDLSTSHELLDATYLDPERCTPWIAFRKRSDALDAAAIDKLDGVAIQAAVLTYSAVAEGLHRRLYDDKKRVSVLSKSDLKQALITARSAALDKLREIDRSGRPELTDTDLAEFEKSMGEALSFINETTFRSRLADLGATAQAAIPHIISSFGDWPAAVKDARNILAHKGTASHSETISQFYDLLIALSYSIPWVLRTVLLLESGIDADTLRKAYELSSAFNHHITNTKNLLADGPYAAR